MTRLISRTSAALLGVALVVVLPLALLVRLQWSPLDDIDNDVDTSVHNFVTAHSFVADLARWLTHLGDPVVVTAVCALVAIALAVRRRLRAAAYLVVVRAVAVLLGWVVKHAVGRARPELPHPIAHAQGQSFPSGHALGSAALFASLAVLLSSRLPTAWVVAIAVVAPVVVATTRVLLGVHFMSDVLAGLALGWLVAVVTADLMKMRRHDVETPDGVREQ